MDKNMKKDAERREESKRKGEQRERLRRWDS